MKDRRPVIDAGQDMIAAFINQLAGEAWHGRIRKSRTVPIFPISLFSCSLFDDFLQLSKDGEIPSENVGAVFPKGSGIRFDHLF